MRLDLAVARRFGLPRRKARDAVRAGRIEADGAACDEPGRDVQEDVALAFHPDRPARRRVRTALAVLAESGDYLIVDKPAGLLTVPTAEGESDTLRGRALDYLHHRYRRRPFAGIVHRLDKDTSGALVFARNRPAQAALLRQFREHTIRREYLALLEGDLSGRSTFDAALSRDAQTRRRSVARGGAAGRRAVTHYEIVERYGAASLARVRLETGRTHQIRIHFAASGHPVLGDAVYRPRGMTAPPPLVVPRQMLHARLLGFSDPSTGETVEAASPLPADFRDAIAHLRGARKRKKEPRSSRGS